MINDPKSAHFIAWTELGTSFVVSNVGEFSRSILGSHFKHNNVSPIPPIHLVLGSLFPPSFPALYANSTCMASTRLIAYVPSTTHLPHPSHSLFPTRLLVLNGLQLTPKLGSFLITSFFAAGRICSMKSNERLSNLIPPSSIV